MAMPGAKKREGIPACNESTSNSSGGRFTSGAAGLAHGDQDGGHLQDIHPSNEARQELGPFSAPDEARQEELPSRRPFLASWKLVHAPKATSLVAGLFRHARVPTFQEPLRGGSSQYLHH